MYVLKYAIKNIFRSFGRNFLLSIIAFVLATASCVALAMMSSAEDARKSSEELINIKAQINVDKQYVMESVGNITDREAMKTAIEEANELSLDLLQEYATSKYVDSFYYTNTVTLNGKEIEPIDSNGIRNEDKDEQAEEQASQTGPRGEQAPEMEMQIGAMGIQGDFSLEGYSSDAAMEDFADGISTITDGQMFDEGTGVYQCIITKELATYNQLSVGDKIELFNSNNDEESYQLTVVGIYETSGSSASTAETSFSTSSDASNKILMSYTALNKIIAYSKTFGDNEDESTHIRGMTSGYYIFKNIDQYDAFEAHLKESGEGKYVLTSNDVATFESSILPLDNLKDFAFAFLIVILAIGSIVLFVLNMVTIRERKYEIGVLLAMGMPKLKVMTQFVTEMFLVMLVAIFLGTAAGSVASVPITNSLLASQVEQYEERSNTSNSNFNRNPQQMNGPQEMTKGGDVVGEVEYISTVTNSVDTTVLVRMVIIGVILTISASVVSMLFIMRFRPLRILATRD